RGIACPSAPTRRSAASGEARRTTSGSLATPEWLCIGTATRGARSMSAPGPISTGGGARGRMTHGWSGTRRPSSSGTGEGGGGAGSDADRGNLRAGGGGPDEVGGSSDRGGIFHRTSTGWASTNTGTGDPVAAGWQLASNDVWATNYWNGPLHWTGAAWTTTA